MKETNLIKLLHTKKGQKQLFDTYYQQMFVVASRYLKVKEDVQDVLSEVFVRIFKNIGKFEFQGDGSLKRWMKTIVINESLRIIRKNNRFFFSDDANEVDIGFTEDFDGNIDFDHIMEMVDTLPNGYRIVFNLYVVEEFSHKEIAEKLNISISTSKTQLFKARGLLIQKIKSEKHEIFRN